MSIKAWYYLVSNYVCKKCDFIYPTDWFVGPNPRCSAGINDVHRHFEGKCPKCGKPVLPHVVCKNCGTYKGVQVIDVLAKLSKKEKKQREKEIKAQEKSMPTGRPAGKKELNAEELSKI